MLKRLINPLSIGVAIGIIILIVISATFVFKQNEFVFVNNEKVFNEFKMTKELKFLGEKQLLVKKGRLDSLYAYLGNVKNDHIKSQIIKEIISQKQDIENYQQSFSVANSDKIWNRINSYLNDYSEIKGYDLVIGSQKQGTAFYGNPECDVTDELVQYINKRYEGSN